MGANCPTGPRGCNCRPAWCAALAPAWRFPGIGLGMIFAGGRAGPGGPARTGGSALLGGCHEKLIEGA